MSLENVYLLGLAAVLCIMNVALGGKVASGIAGFFARFSSPKLTPPQPKQ
jgi:hypothetical protein